MVCIYCGADTKVTNSRHQKRNNNVWRRRQCVSCRAIFTTNEAADLLRSLSVVSDKHLEPFSRDKLFLSIHDSLKHRKTAQNDATGLTATVISRLYPFVITGSIKGQDIINMALEALKRFDKAAFIHYQAFHKSQL